MERRIAMSLVFSRTIMASVLNIARPAMSVKMETVIPVAIRSARKTPSQDFSRSCHAAALCWRVFVISAASSRARSLSKRLTWR
jgi:hypothetical protein